MVMISSRLRGVVEMRSPKPDFGGRNFGMMVNEFDENNFFGILEIKAPQQRSAKRGGSGPCDAAGFLTKTSRSLGCNPLGRCQ